MTTEAAPAAPTPTPGASDLAAAPPAPSAAPVSGQPLTREAALAAIEAAKGDKEFYSRITSDKPDIKAAALAQWEAWHKDATQPSKPEEVVHQENLRATAAWQASLEKHRAAGADLTAAMEAEYLAHNPVAVEVRQEAQRRVEHVIHDAAWRTRFFSGDRQAKAEWWRCQMVLELPVKRG